MRAWPSRPLVWLDNGGDAEVVIALDGETVASVPARGCTALTLPSGAHRLEARATSAPPAQERVVDEQRIDAHRGQRWIWNIGGVQRYAVYAMTYGKDHPGDEPRPVATSERLFVMPADVAPDFMQLLPSVLTVAHGTGEATARALDHFAAARRSLLLPYSMTMSTPPDKKDLRDLRTPRRAPSRTSSASSPIAAIRSSAGCTRGACRASRR